MTILEIIDAQIDKIDEEIIQNSTLIKRHISGHPSEARFAHDKAGQVLALSEARSQLCEIRGKIITSAKADEISAIL